MYMSRGAIEKLAVRNGVSISTVRVMFGKECPARKVLPCRIRPVYVRRVVFELLGLDDPLRP